MNSTIPSVTRDTRVTRTVLAVPAHRRRMVESAAASCADAVFLDLEDAVPEEHKDAALVDACRALAELDWGAKTVAVRVNAHSTERFAVELAHLARHAPRLDSVLLPKVETIDDVHAALRAIGSSDPRRARALGIELMIETARGLVNCEQLAQADRRIESLHFGVGDFSASIGAKSVDIGLTPRAYRHTWREPDGTCAATPLDLWAYPMMRLLVAARAFGLRAIDGPCGAFRDHELTRGLAEKAAAMGFDGKQVIHPCQIDATRDAFMPSAAELAQARRVIAALDDAARNAQGAIQLDGKLIDYVSVRMAQRIVALAQN